MRITSCRFSSVLCLILGVAAASLPAAPPSEDVNGDLLPDGAVARMGSTRLRHDDGVCQVAYSDDGKLLASLGRDRTLRVWNAITGQQLHVFWEKDLDFFAVAWSPDGLSLAAAGGDPLHGGNTGIRFFDVKTGKEIKRFVGHDQPASRIAFSADGKTLISASFGQVIRWNTASGDKRSEWKLRNTAALAVAPDRAALAWVDAESEDRSVHIADAASGKELRRLEGGHEQPIISVAYSPDGKYIASGNPSEPIHLWDAATGKTIREFDQQQGGLSLRFSVDGKLLAGGCMDGGVRLWEVETGKELPRLTGYNGWINGIEFAPNGKTLALAGTDSHVIHVWNVATGKECQPIEGHRGQIFAVAFSPDGKLMASGGGDGHEKSETVYLWDAVSGRQVGRLIGHIGRVCSLQFSPDSKRLISASEKEDVFRVWEMATAREIVHFARPTNQNAEEQSQLCAVAWSPDGSLLASAHDRGVLLLWDAKTGAQLRTCKGHEGMIHSLAFSPDGKVLASGSVDCTLRLWDADTASELHRFDGLSDSVRCVAFSSDGRMIAAASGDYEGFHYIWEISSKRELARLPASRGRIYQVAFSPDSKLLAGTGPDNCLCVWEIATRVERCRFPGHPGGGLAIAFSPNGRTLASGSQDTTVLLWNVSHCKELGRPRTEQDLDQLWNELGSHDGKVAHRTICTLLADPEKTVKLLKQRLRPFATTDRQRMAKALEELDNDRFQVREKASMELANLGDLAEPFLRQTLEQQPSLEVRQRIQLLLGKLESSPLPADQLRLLRAFEILERIGDAEARTVLEAHVRQLPTGRIHQQAQASLERITRRQP